MMVQQETQVQTNEVAAGVWPVVWATLVGGLAVLFGTTIVSVAIGPLAREFNVPIGTIQWVSTGYLLALAVTIPIVGWAQRRIGGRRLWILGLVVFLIGSILSSLAWSAPALIAFRAVQGIGGGIIMPLMMTLVMQAAGGRGIGRIMSVISMPAVLGPIVGPVLGGLILDHLSWPWLFWVNVPFSIAGLILAITLIPKDGPAQRVRLDVVGFALMGLSLVGLLYGLSNAGQDGHFARLDVIAPMIAGVALLAAFAIWAVRRGSRAIIDVKLLRHWPLTSASLLLFLSGFALYGAMLLLPLYFQELRGLSPMVAGLLLIPQGLGTFVSRSIAGRLTDSIGARWVAVVGFVVVVLGTLSFAFADQHTSYIWICIVLFVRGIGLGGVTLPLMALAYQGIDAHDVPEASLVSRIGQQLGGSFGAAILTVILEGAAATLAPAGAFETAFWWTTGFSVVALVLAFFLPGQPRSPATPDRAAPSRESDLAPETKAAHGA